MEKYKKWENAMVEKLKKIINDNKRVFLIVLIFGIIIHLFALTNKLVNWDDFHNLFAKGAGIDVGRWFLNCTSLIFPDYSMPVFIGIISLVLLSASACLISNILEVKNDFNKILVGLILVSFPTITCTFTYMFTAHSYMLALLMAIFSAYFAKKNGKSFWILSIVLLVLSLGIYQAYISITATLLIILLIKETLQEKEFKRVLLKALRFLVILVISLILYAIINKVVVEISGVELSDYQGASSMGSYSIQGILKGVLSAYKHILHPFKTINPVAPTNISRIIYILCFVLNLVLVGKKIWKNRENKLNSLFSIGFIFLLPLTMNMIYILNENVNHTCVMRLGDSFIFINLILLLEKIDRNYFNRMIKLCIIIQIFSYFILANESYLEMHLAYENTFAFYQGIVTTITQTEGFDENSRIVMIGEYQSKELNRMEEFQNIPNGMFGVVNSESLIHSYSKLEFIKNYIGFNGNFVKDKEIEGSIKRNEEFKNMPAYPYYGSIKKIDDLIVVKLSEE